MTDLNLPSPSDIIEGAIEVVNQGWCQGDLYKHNPDNPNNGGVDYCTIGALRKSKQDLLNSQRGEDYDRALDIAFVEIATDATMAVGEAIGASEEATRVRPATGIAEWNDAEGRTKDEVITVLTTVAKDLRNQGR